MERDRLEDILQRKLGGFEMEAAPGGFDRIADRLPRRRRPLVLRWAYAAAVLLALVLGGTWLFLPQDRPVGTAVAPKDPLNGSALSSSVPPRDTVRAEKETQESRPAITPARKPQLLSTAPPNASFSGNKARTTAERAEAEEEGILQIVPDLSADTAALRPDTQPSPSSGTGAKASARPGHKKTRTHDLSVPASGRKGGWGIGLYADNLAVRRSGQEERGGRVLSSDAGSGPVLVEVNGLRNEKPEVVSRKLDHRFPVSAGIAVRKRLGDRLSVQSGVLYTYLKSSGEMEAAFRYKYDQKLHYIGIPLAVSYTLLRTGGLDLYATGGGAVEKCVSARGDMQIYQRDGTLASRERYKPKAGGLQWSVNAAGGLAYDFVPRFGLYAEPGVSYYFRNGRQPESYRTEHRLNFSLRVGLRTSF